MKICLSCEGVTNAAANRCGHCGAWLLPTEAVHYPVRRGEVDAGNPLLGTVIDGKYRLQGVLGRGGLGTVFRAQHIGSLMPVALKLLHPRFAERPEYRRALLPEARRAATVTHERCARLLDVGEAEDGVAYLAMELVEGETLDLVVRRGPLAPSLAVEVLAQVAEALAAIHAVGLVHCDLSPRNVMVSPHGDTLRVKVLDFGIARSVSLAGPARQQGEFAGFVNPAFAAPELLAGGAVDARADLWSFGTLAWLLLTGGMPVDDTDPRLAAAAVAAGELRPWPGGLRLPRRLVRLVQRCLVHDPAGRPPSASAVGEELAIVRGARRAPLVRAAFAALGLGVLVALAGGGGAGAPFLLPLSGSQLEWSRGSLPLGQPASVMPSRRLDTLGFDYGGFQPSRLRADLVRDGQVLSHTTLRPEVGAVAGNLLLSTAQADWRQVVQGLLRTSADGPIDLVFVVPGAAPLGSMRLRLDDTPPVLAAELLDGPPLRAGTRLRCSAEDAVGLAAVTATVQLASGRALEVAVPATGGEFTLGEALAAASGMTSDLGAGELVVAAVDRAGNRQALPPIPFASCDLAAPEVLDVAGPLGEALVPLAAGTVRLRLRTTFAEPGCRLQVAFGAEAGPELPLPATGTVHVLEFAVPDPVRSGPWRFAVTDGAGNRTERELPVGLRDRSTHIEFTAEEGMARQLDDELVVADRPTSLVASLAASWAVAAVRVELSVAPRSPASSSLVQWSASSPGAVDLRLQALPPGRHLLRFDLGEVVGDGERGMTASVAVPLRVLPASLELRVPVARSRFLPGLLQAGVLRAHGQGYVDGPAWGLDPALRPYLHGQLWLGGMGPVALPIGPAAAGEPLLPEFRPVPGHTVLALEVVDVLGRPLRIGLGEEPPAPEHQAPQRTVVVDFWWHDEAPALVGEELLLEYGQPARIELRCPLPYGPDDVADLRLGVLQTEVPAASVTGIDGDRAVVVFELPFPVWSVAAQLAERTRDDFATQLQRRIEAYVVTPVGRSDLQLRLRTTRSTLRPFGLAELPAGSGALAGIRLLPVLAPSAPFAEPVPAMAPPRATFRPQVATPVRNLVDFLLQDREFTCGEARALVAAAGELSAAERARCVHHDDPLGLPRTTAAGLLPAASAAAPDEATLVGVSFYQAWTLSRLLGLVVVRDPEAFRLPLGCELELAAFGVAPPRACHGAGAHGGKVAIAAFLGAAGAWPVAAASRAAGDVVPTAFGEPFVGLDFGVREWVLDLPHVPGAELLLGEWLGDHGVHLARVMDQARGVVVPMLEPSGQLRSLGVVRGLAFGQRGGLIDARGRPLDVRGLASLPDGVPGVLRTEQLRRDGLHLLAGDLDPRLQWVGFRVVGVPERLVLRRGRR